MFLLKVLLFSFNLHSYIFRDATFCQCIASHTAVLQRNYEVFERPKHWLAGDFYRGGERGCGKSFERADFTCYQHMHKNPSNSRREERARLWGGDRRKGEIGVMTYLHQMRIDWNSLKAYAILQACAATVKQSKTPLSEINLADIEILGSVDKPWTKISSCPTTSSCFHVDIS